ncbi:MAG: NTP transferase domain-containing protein [Kiritimatiellaeota bacterium]|nr:NTP transferase domain-containing protein [Kiritimatiellota bacterium]
MNNKRNGKRVVATIEARMTSSRLPGKVLLESIGRPMLQLMTERLASLELVDEIVIATTVNEMDKPIVDLAERIGARCYRGSEEDVLSRVLGAAHENDADVIVELTGDCPLIDPKLVDDVVETYLSEDCDYATNCLAQTFPLGMEAEVFSTELLELADREGDTSEDREHVSWFFVRNPDRFKLLNIEASANLKRPSLRLTLDEEPDYRVIDAVFNEFESSYATCACGDIIRFLDDNPGLLDMSRNIVHRGDWESVAKDVAGVE